MARGLNIIVCSGLVMIGALSYGLLFETLALGSVLNFVGGLGGFAGGVCAVIALIKWKKQIHYNRKLEFIEALEKVHSLCAGLAFLSGELLVNTCTKDAEFLDDRFKRYLESTRKKYDARSDRIRESASELTVKSRVWVSISDDKKVQLLNDSVLSCVNKFLRLDIPVDAEISDVRKVGITLHDLGNEINQARAALFNYLNSSKND